LSENEYWKERLGFTSGIILLWGLVLLKLYPIASHIQLIDHIFLSRDGKASAEVILFATLTFLSALGATTLLLAVIHIASRGLWLAATVDSADLQVLREQLSTTCEQSFVSVFDTMKTALGMLAIYPMLLAIVLVQRGFHSLFSIQSVLGGVVVYVFSFFVVVIIEGSLKSIPLPSIFQEKRKRVLRFISGAMEPLGRLDVLAIFMIFSGLFFWFTYTANFKLNHETIYRSKSDVLEISIDLGGMTSDIKKAELMLIDAAGQKRQIKPRQDIGDGRYLSHLYSSSLSPGMYTVEFEYPWWSVSSVYPFINTRIRDKKRFVVLE